MAMLGTPAMAPGISVYADIVMELGIEVGICIEPCMAAGEPYERVMLCGVENEECSDM